VISLIVILKSRVNLLSYSEGQEATRPTCIINS